MHRIKRIAFFLKLIAPQRNEFVFLRLLLSDLEWQYGGNDDVRSSSRLILKTLQTFSRTVHRLLFSFQASLGRSYNNRRLRDRFQSRVYHGQEDSRKLSRLIYIRILVVPPSRFRTLRGQLCHQVVFKQATRSSIWIHLVR